MDGGLIFLILLVVGLYGLSRLGELAEKTRMNSIREEKIREMVKQKIQQRRLDRLYGRDKD